jgi:hypothetical protein
MTAPVLSKINSKTAFTDDEEVFTMSFFLGYNLQKEGTAPIPEEEQVFLHKLESKRYGVISYSGYSNKSVQEENLRKLGNYLAKNEVKFNSNYYFFAGYDSPFTFFNRHNEVWVELI